MVGALAISYAAISMQVASTSNPLFFGGKFLNGFAAGTIQGVMTTYIGEVHYHRWIFVMNRY